MKTSPIVAAQVVRDEHGVPFSPMFGDAYHPAAGALQQAEHVFLHGNGLPERFAGRDRFVVLETGFGLGNNFLATWNSWRQAGRPCRLHFISVEQHPLSRADMAAMPREPSVADLAAHLVEAWPPLTPNLHRLSFDNGQVELLLALGDAASWLPELLARVDAFFLDGFSPSKNPQMWQERLFKAMGRLAAPGATAATWSAAKPVRQGLTTAGFAVERRPGVGGKFDITVARYAPAFVPKAAPARIADAASAKKHAAIIGGGLAGCSTAWALAQQGWTSTVFDANERPAQAASGNPAGLFHGIVNAQDGAHARFNRAAALQAQRTMRELLDESPDLGRIDGLLRLETSGQNTSAMSATLARLGLPADYVQALDALAASQVAGMPLQHPAWFYPGGGWMRPAALCEAFLTAAKGRADFRGDVRAGSLQRDADGWTVLDAQGQVITTAEVVVLANAGDALRLLDGPDWPMEPVRGQLSICAIPRGTATPSLPVAGSGYLLPSLDGMAVFGATTQPGDDVAECREADHRFNLGQVGKLTGNASWLQIPPTALSGRVGWRWMTDDRLPVIGAVPLGNDELRGARLDQPRFVPRRPGLFVFTGLGSRGITWCALGSQVLASLITGAPMPIEASLLDAVDVGRFASRDARRR
jgi:tRNA 5-methylaminomethyl-2-thiouridine biosynthesis bifunctional protein